MKKVLFVAIIATLIAVGCEKTEIINPNLGTEILFSPELGKLTKAEGDPTTLQTQGFKVTAIMAYEDPYTTVEEFGKIYDGISNTPFGYTANGWAPTGNVTQYWWPGTDKELVFVAISSKGNQVSMPAIYDENDNPSGLRITETTQNVGDTQVKNITMSPYKIEGFEVTPAATTPAQGETPASHTIPDDDLMIADAVQQHQGENSKVVDLKFRHALSKVEFWFVTNGQNVQNEYPALKLYVDNANITTGETAKFTVVYQTDANTTEDLTTGYSISYGENSSLNGNEFTPTTDGQYTFTASYTVDNKTYISNEVVVTVGQQTNVVERTANENITVVVKSIKVANVISKGDLTVTPIWEGDALLSSYYNGEDDKTDTFAWTPSQETKEEYSITKNLELTVSDQNYATWLVIPQTIKEGNTTELKVEIAYTINNRDFTSIFPLYTARLTKWGVNQYIKYTINLSPNLITFNPSVEDWSNPTDVDHNN